MSSNADCVQATLTDARLQALLGSGPRRVDANDEIAVVSQQMQGNAPARHAVLFQWHDILQTEGPNSAHDTVYELASVLIAVAVWRQRRALYLCQGGKTGTDSQAAIKVLHAMQITWRMWCHLQSECHVPCGPVMHGVGTKLPRRHWYDLHLVGVQPFTLCWRPLPVRPRQVYPSSGQHMSLTRLQLSGMLHQIQPHQPCMLATAIFSSV